MLTFTAIIWGMAFADQRMGKVYVGPFIFNAVSFAFGGFAILAFFWLQSISVGRSKTKHLAALEGWVFLREMLSFREVIGGGLILTGMLVSISSYVGTGRLKLKRVK